MHRAVVAGPTKGATPRPYPQEGERRRSSEFEALARAPGAGLNGTIIALIWWS
jgi:hypothetical protein